MRGIERKLRLVGGPEESLTPQRVLEKVNDQVALSILATLVALAGQRY